MAIHLDRIGLTYEELRAAIGVGHDVAEMRAPSLVEMGANRDEQLLQGILEIVTTAIELNNRKILENLRAAGVLG